MPRKNRDVGHPVDPTTNPTDASAVRTTERPASGVDLRPHDRRQLDSLRERDRATTQILRERGMHVAEPLEYDFAAGFAPRATGAPTASARRGPTVVDQHRAANQPAGGTADGKMPFANLRDSKG